MPIKKLRRITDLTEVSAEDEMRRAYGVGELVKLMSDKPVPGKSYHIITGGAIDLICHLYWLLRHWPCFSYALIYSSARFIPPVNTVFPSMEAIFLWSRLF